jgi:hypothetical protein
MLISAARSQVVMYILRDVIRDWKSCTAYLHAYFSVDGSDDEEENDNDDGNDEGGSDTLQEYDRVVSILENVHALLEPKCSAMDESESQHPPDSPERISQIHKLLPREMNPSRSGWFPAGPAQQVATSIPDSYKLASRRKDECIAVYCFLQDMLELRLYVRKTWAEYKHQKVSPTTASLTMNAAIDLVERVNDDLITWFPPLKDHWQITNMFMRGRHDPGVAIPLDDRDALRWYTSPVQSISRVALTCFHTWSILDELLLAYYNPMEHGAHKRYSIYPAAIKHYKANVFPHVSTPDEQALFDVLSAITAAHAVRPHDISG